MCRYQKEFVGKKSNIGPYAFVIPFTEKSYIPMVVHVWTISGRCEKQWPPLGIRNVSECKILVKQNRQQLAELIQAIAPLA